MFDRTDTCSQSTEVAWITDTQTELAAPVRWTLAGLTGLVVGAPVVAGAVVVMDKAGSSGGKLLEVIGPVAAVIILGSAAGAYAGSGTAIGNPSATTQRVEIVRRPEVTSVIAKPQGSFSIGDGPKHPLVDGAVELSLADSLALTDGDLRLDGSPVDLVGLEAGDRLRKLVACERANQGDVTGLSDAQKKARLVEVNACRLGGWSFADRVLSALSP